MNKTKTVMRISAFMALLFLAAVLLAGTHTRTVLSAEVDNTETADLLANFWESDIVYEESAMLIAETDYAGNLISAPRAKLLFKDVTKILEVKSYYHPVSKTTVIYEEGNDYVLRDGYLVATGNFSEDGKSYSTDMPYVTDKQAENAALFPGISSSNAQKIPSKNDGLYLPFSESQAIVQMQIVVTYEHSDEWNGSTPTRYGTEKFSKSLTKMQNGEDIDLFVFGDSISTGANCSGYLGIAPNMGAYYELFAQGLEQEYDISVNIQNNSRGGWDTRKATDVSDEGSEGTNPDTHQKDFQRGITRLFAEDLKDYKPDIAIVAFGTNDATRAIPLTEYLNNTKIIIDTILTANPDCDIVLIGTWIANPMSKDHDKNQGLYNENLYKLAALYENAAVVNMGYMSRDLINMGKDFIEISANNVNHPNDFSSRMYAMNLLEAFREPVKA